MPRCWCSAPRARRRSSWTGPTRSTRSRSPRPTGVTQEELAAAADTVAPEGFEAVTGDQVAEESQDAVGQFLDVISTFLLVFAIIAVIVGGFIIVNTFTILVAQRSRELALLRALGAGRRQVTSSVLLEAVVMSALAATAGIALGWLLARGLAALFRAVGLDIAGDELTLDLQAVLVSYAVGIGVTLVAAYLPARRAGKVAPVAAMRADATPVRGSLRRRTIIGGVLLAVGAAFAVVGIVGGPGPDALWIGIAAVIWILTAAAISSVLGQPVLVLCRSLFGRLFGTTGRLAGENALRDPRRTGATASALMIGLALVSCIGVLAASLNASVDDVVDEEFTSDFLVQSTNFLPVLHRRRRRPRRGRRRGRGEPAAVDGRAGGRRDRLPDRQRRGVRRHLRPRGRRRAPGAGGQRGPGDQRTSPRTTGSRSARR